MKTESFKLEWDAREYEHKERGQDWFWGVGIISVSIAIVSVILGNIIFGILILTAVFSLAIFINRPPENVHVVIDEKGISKDRVKYPYSALKSFWIDVEHNHPKILLASNKPFLPLVIIPLGEEVVPEELANILSKKISEEYHSLPLVEKILEYIGF